MGGSMPYMLTKSIYAKRVYSINKQNVGSWMGLMAPFCRAYFSREFLSTGAELQIRYSKSRERMNYSDTFEISLFNFFFKALLYRYGRSIKLFSRNSVCDILFIDPSWCVGSSFDRWCCHDPGLCATCPKLWQILINWLWAWWKKWCWKWQDSLRCRFRQC